MDKITTEQRGFSLIELMVVLSILGLLAGIAIGQYKAYRGRAFDARAVSDLRNAMSAQESYFVDNETYVADIANLTGFDTTSPSITLVMAGDADGWSGSSYHPAGTNTYCYDSTNNDGIVTVDGLASTCP